MTLQERFLKYVSFDTRSDPASDSVPSTPGQTALLHALAAELRALGLAEVELHAGGASLTATLPAVPGCEDAPTIGFIAHVDTSPDLSGRNIRPQFIEKEGDTIITSDGTTLLGADDKAGVAEIVTAAEYLLAHPEIAHGRLRLAFTTDEEIGRGTDHFDIQAFGAAFAYTVDGGAEGELEYENFNAAAAHLTIRGRNAHPGDAKGKMLNALEVAHEFHAALPPAERPELTEGREGFFHRTSLRGTVERAEAEYILRDFSRERFEARKNLMKTIENQLNSQYEEGTVTVHLTDTYYNMQEMIAPHPELIEKARMAMQQAGTEPIIKPIRGGTDGARLSFMGLPCPNLFTGGGNFHSRDEFCSLRAMEKAVETLVNLARLWAVTP